MNLAYHTMQDAAAALVARYFRGDHMLPYNWHNLGRSRTWWLSPTGEKVAYRYGKAIFTTNEGWASPGQVFCGFCVEKGVVPDASEKSSEVMQEDWFWHRFVKVANEPLAGRIEESSKALGAKLSLGVFSSVLTKGARQDNLVFEVEGTALDCRRYESGDGVLTTLASCTNLSGFADELKSFGTKEKGWYWVNVLVGHEFTIDPARSDDLEPLAAMLKPFERWMRALAG